MLNKALQKENKVTNPLKAERRYYYEYQVC
jgi:hypothetical protein